jgi:hypothetical protein
MFRMSFRLLLGVVAGCTPLSIAKDAHAQPEQYSQIVIQAPPELAEARVQVTLGQTTSPVYLDSTAAAQITVAEGDSASSYLQVRYAMRRESGTWAAVIWRDSVDLVRDGEIIVTLEDDVQPGQVGQFETTEWPVVTWSTTAGSLDAYLNGRSRGTTDQTRAIRPDRDHRLEWRSDSTVVCARIVRLDNGQRRKFSCDRATGHVTQN